MLVKNQAIRMIFISGIGFFTLCKLTVYADGTTNDVLSLTGTLASQAVINVVSNKTQYMSGVDSGIPGLPGVALVQNINVDIACTNGMLIKLLLDSLNGLSLISPSTSQLKIPYQISIQNTDFTNISQSQTTTTASIVCHGEVIKVPINITTGNLPYGLSAGNYQDVLQLNLSY